MAVDRKRIYHKRDRLRQLRAFCQVARLSSITQAAESLGVSQPSVSIQIRELENELETVLFDRSGSGIALTRAGKRLFELAEPLVQRMDELSVTLMEGFDGATPDHIQLAATAVGAACVLPPYVKRFRDSCILDTDRVSVIPLKEYFPTRSFGVFTRRGKHLTPPALRFLRLMIPDFPEPLPPPPLTDRGNLQTGMNAATNAARSGVRQR